MKQRKKILLSRRTKMKRICAYCGKKIHGYPHVTVWDEQPLKSEGIRFHTIEEAILYYTEKLGRK